MKACPLCRGRGYFDRWSYQSQDGFDGHEPDDVEGLLVTVNGEHVEVVPSRAQLDSLHKRPPGSGSRYASYWEVGAVIDHEAGAPDDVGVEPWRERAACGECHRRREEYADRRKAKVDRRRERAAKLRGESAAARERSQTMLPWGGEPIKVGHHSEKRHRRDQQRAHDQMRKSVEAHREAERQEHLADAAESNRAVSSDDPDAIVKLRARVGELEAYRERIKAANRAAKKAGKPIADAYVLTNLGGNIRRIKLRLADLERAALATVPEDLEIGACRIEWDGEANRVRVYSPDPGTQGRKARSTLMRGFGFIWSRAAGAWQRQASRTAWESARTAAKKIEAGS